MKVKTLLQKIWGKEYVKKFVFCILVTIFISGCATTSTNSHPYAYLPSAIRNQIESIEEQAEQKAIQLRNRKQEAKLSLENGQISQGEYLIIKNQIDKEADDYFANSKREVQDILNRYYEYRRSLY